MARLYKETHAVLVASTSPPIQQRSTPPPNGHDETFNVTGWSPARTVHDTPSSTHSSLPPPESDLESYGSTDDTYQLASDAVDIQKLLNKYWNSTAHEFIVSSQLLPPTTPLISDREAQSPLSLDRTMGT
jgi:hypothetical protein